MNPILYLHGFNSSPASHKAQVLQRYLSERGEAASFHCPALAPDPDEAAACIADLIAGLDTPPVLIGSSLGGFFATWAAERFNTRAILVNPSVRPFERFQAYLGPQRNLYTGEEYVLTAQHVARLAALQVGRLTPARYWLLVETGDLTLDYREAVAAYAGCRQTIIEGGDHSFQSWERLLPQLMSAAGQGAQPVWPAERWLDARNTTSPAKPGNRRM